MRRGQIYTAAARGAHSGKPRPVVIVQDDHFDATASVKVCPMTTVRRENVGERVGQLQDTDVVRLNRALLVFLGLVG